ncbi:Protein of unknown function [Gryllus bimaculatus]|nr:Protein of unknown function [Gryllus bimaculatus]
MVVTIITHYFVDSTMSKIDELRSPAGSPWSRLSLLLSAPDGERTWRWSYVPLTEQSPPAPRPRAASPASVGAVGPSGLAPRPPPRRYLLRDGFGSFL